MRAPLLQTGFIVDDYAQLAMMAGTYPVPRSPLALFTFTNGHPPENQALKDAGFFPWWTHPALKISLFRPVASALMWLDRAAFGDKAWLFHVHSAIWWLCMSVTWGVLARRFLPWSWAVFVHILCTLHPANGMLIGWIANRNASIAMFFGLLALLLQEHRRECEGRLRIAQWLIPFCWAMALLAGEYGASMLAFCLMYEVTGSQSAAKNWSVLKPCLAVSLVYLLSRTALSFGSRNSGMYIDPAGEPLAFIRAAMSRGPVLVADLVLGLRSNWWSGGYPWAPELARTWKLGDSWMFDLQPLRRLHVVAGLVSIAVGGWLAWFAQRENPKLRFAALALPLSLLPAVGGTPESRLLLPAMFGWSLLLAHGIRELLTRAGKQTRATTVFGILAVGLLTAIETKASFEYSAQDRSFLPRVAKATRTSILDANLEGIEEAFLVAAVDPTTTIYIPMVRRWHHHQGPARCHLLLSTVASMRIERLSSNEFRVSRSHTFYTPPDVYAEAFRRESLQVGQTFTMQTMRATVETVQKGMPISVSFKTTRNLDHPSMALVTQTVSGLRVLRFPAVGESLTLDPPNFPLDLMREDKAD